ncbi:MAG: hypothetical protein ABSA13_17305 [Beijerinckiaceae bacterium]|jgi:hypothetical protein
MITETYLRDDPFAAAAARTAAHMIKSRARHYLRRPPALEALYPGLSHAGPQKMIAISAHLIERESLSPRRWFGFGGEVNLINAKAAGLLGRVMRRAEGRGERGV